MERKFALGLLGRNEVKVFVKLPSAFTIPTPLGRYNPDWAVTIERPDGSRYIVFETKGTNETALLAPIERGKTQAARVHFAVIRHDIGMNDLEYEVVRDINAANAVIEREA